MNRSKLVGRRMPVHGQAGPTTRIQRGQQGRLPRGVAVTVQGPAPGTGHHGRAMRMDLLIGQSLDFGSCGCRDCAIDMPVPASAGHWVRGVLTAHENHWSLDNLSTMDLMGLDLEDQTQRVRIPPGRVGVAMPFELAHVGSVGQDDDEMLTVFGQEPRWGGEPQPCPEQRSMLHEIDLKPDATYMAVLRALCTPVVGSPRPLPSSSEIVTLLAEHGVRLSRRAVDHHIDYLFDRFFPQGSHGGPPGWKREAVARTARVGGLV